jgi:regulator of protease activity HflC (stomatin/prohibitin superfamily)
MADPKPPKLNLPRRSAGRLFGVAIAGFLVFLVGAASLSLTATVEADEFAVRQVYLGPNKGVQEHVYGPGLHVVLPGYERLHTFPRDLQVLDMNDSEVAHNRTSRDARQREDHRVAPAIRIQTSEGYQVTVDVTVLYRVVDPYTVITRVGAGKIYETTVVARRADKILRQTLGRLDAEDFYDDQKRMEMAESARQELGTDLEPWGVQVWAVLLREYNYDDRYQNAIELRKIQDQKVFKNQAETVAAKREAEKNRVVAQGTAAIDVELQRGMAEVRKINADAELYYRTRLAEGDKLVALAEAEGARLENDALQQAGASNIVGLEMAKTLEGAKIIVVSTTGAGATNPLDLDQLLEGW